MNFTNKELWFKSPASSWLEALPLGNGKLGAMVFGKVKNEVYQLNEESIWAGEKIDSNNYTAINHLEQVRKLIREGNYKQAQEISDEKLLAIPKNIKPYETLGNLCLTFDYDYDYTNAENYKRKLNLQEAVSNVSFTLGENTYHRESFISYPQDVLVIKISSSQKSKISFTASLTREAQSESIGIDKNNLGIISTKTSGINFYAQLRILNCGGEIYEKNNSIVVDGADSVILLFSSKTSFNNVDFIQKCKDNLEKAQILGYDQLKINHICSQESLFNRMDLSIDTDITLSNLSTVERLDRVKEGKEDLGLVELYFHLGRYLLISSSRQGSLPANLQGLWNDSLKPAWNSDYHLNINLQMNYWLAESCNLDNCHEPLFDFIESLVIPGRKTAKVHYNCGGFVVHHVTDIFGFTSPADGAKYGIWPMGAAWLCQHLYEHYAFSKDINFLKKYYWIMKESAQFFVDYLIEDEKGYLITSPSISPENTFIYNDEGDFARLCSAPAMDMQIIYDLFTNCVIASEAINEDKNFANKLINLREKLSPPSIDKYGRLQEWNEEFKEYDAAHRHISHVFGFYPGKQFSLKRTPQLCKAIRNTIERRLEHGGGGTGWSRAWLIGLFARFEEGDIAYENILKLLRESTLNNMLDLHPPSPTAKTHVFQIDGNLGTTAAIAEMLIHSHDGEIKILPALPSSWVNGEVNGLRARNGFEVDIKWQNNKAVDVRITSFKGEMCKIYTGLMQGLYLNDKYIPLESSQNNCFEFETENGKKYIIKFT